MALALCSEIEELREQARLLQSRDPTRQRDLELQSYEPPLESQIIFFPSCPVLLVASTVVFDDTFNRFSPFRSKLWVTYSCVFECPLIHKRMTKSAISAHATAMLEPRTNHPAVTKGAAQIRVVQFDGVQPSFA